jgi:twitching motility protein PilT
VTQFTQPSLPTAPAVATQFTQPPAPAPSAAAPQYLDPRTSGSFPDPFGQPEPPTIPAAPIIPVPPIIPIQVEEQDAPRSSRSRGDGPQGDPELKAALQEVLLSGASDLHLTSNAPPMIRIDGGLRPIEGAPVWSRDRVARAIASILSREQLDQFEEHLELDLAYTLSANARFRVNVYQQRGAIGGAFRIIPTGIKPLTELGMPPSISRFAELARGLVLVTGPTGSGKSTTLAALIDLVNRTRADHIVTVEDPIEFLHENHRSLINQREVGSDTHSFGNALKHVLRQDPDVILIGELRDLETISVALTAAETGHLVFATLHTQDASQTIDRVIDVFPPHQQGQVRAQLAATLQGVVCQTLVKRAGGSGRAVATEVMVTTPAIANLIREGKTFQIPSAMQAGRSLGMHTMDQHLAELVNAGIISQEAAFEKAHDADGIKRLIQRVESPIQATSRAMSAGSIDFGDSFSGV